MKKFGFQNKKSKNYFEGWYFRFTDQVNYAIIFAVTKNEEDPHAFIQLFNENSKKCIYKRYDISAFNFSDNTVHIDHNKLSLNAVFVEIDGYKIDLNFKKTNLLKKSAMGYLSNAPLDCFQEVILMDGTAEGMIDGKKANGTIYIEKTYGNKFPKKWIWLQSNHSKNNSSISFSVGYIPLLFFTVPGWLLSIQYGKEKLNFHSLAFARLHHNETGFTVKKFNTKIEVTFKQGKTIELVGPTKKAKMDIPVYESLTSNATVKIFKKKEFVFEDEYTNVGLEYMMKKST